MNVSDFNRWRSEYDSLSFKEQAHFYKQLLSDHPNQTHFSRAAVLEFMSGSGASKIVELGGNDGGLADVVLGAFPSVESWHNYELSGSDQVCNDQRYEVFSDEFLWRRHHAGYDALVASHILEHITTLELDRLLDAVPVSWLYTDIPVAPGGSWDHTTAAHISRADEIIPVIESHGFEKFMERDGSCDSHRVRGYRR